MEKIRRINWSVEDNDFVATFNNFLLCITMGVINNEDDQADIAFVLAIQSLTENKKAFCPFYSLEDVMFFVNHYVINCNTITEINNNYNSYCISEHIIKAKGYTS